MKQIDLFAVDPEKKFYPKFVFQRLPITKPTERFFYKIDFSSGYFLRRVYLKFPSLIKDPTLQNWTPNFPVVPNLIIYPSLLWKSTRKSIDLMLRCLSIGQTGNIEPEWSAIHGDNNLDNTTAWRSESAYNVQCPRLKLAFIDSANFLNRQPEPIPADLIGTPATEGAFLIEAPAPVDQNLFGLNWNTPHPPTSTSTLNFLYKYGDVIQIEITGQERQQMQNGDFIYCPNFLDLFLNGYYLPTGLFENK